MMWSRINIHPIELSITSPREAPDAAGLPGDSAKTAPGFFLEGIHQEMDMHRSENNPELHAIALEAMARSLVDQWAKETNRAGEAGVCLYDEEYAAITAAYCSGDPIAHFQATDKAIRRVLAELAEREAEQELERKQREERRRHEEDRAADRAEFRRAFA